MGYIEIIIRNINAMLPIKSMGRFILSIVYTPFDRYTVIPIPIVMHKSAVPDSTSAFTAVGNAFLPPVRIIPKRGISSPSQKNSITIRLFASTAPFTNDNVTRR
jgi:hypothetical protein